MFVEKVLKKWEVTLEKVSKESFVNTFGRELKEREIFSFYLSKTNLDRIDIRAWRALVNRKSFLCDSM